MPSKNSSFGKIAIFLAGLGGCAAFGWHVFKGTPRYSLSQLKTAIQQSDREEIPEYIDSKTISAQIVDTALETIQQQTGAITGDIFGQLGASIGRGIIETMRPVMEQQIEQSINAALLKSSEIEAKKIKLITIQHIGEDKAIATFDISQIPNSKKLEKPFISVVLKQQETRQWKIVGLDTETLEMFAKLAAQN